MANGSIDETAHLSLLLRIIIIATHRLAIATQHYLNALRAYTATVPMTQYDVPEVSRRFRPHLPLHFAIQIAEK